MGACVGGLYSIDGVGPRVVPQSAITDHRTCIVAVVDLDRAEMEHAPGCPFLSQPLGIPCSHADQNYW